jgi:AraC-like DNA-binding protein
MAIAQDVYKKIVTAKVFIDENFQDDLDLDRLSKEACLSRFHFHRLFTRIYQRTPHQYLTRRRIEQARLWLADDDLTITEICIHIGFESVGSFSVLFKKQSGFAPLHFRHHAQQKRQQVLQQPRSFIPQCFIDAYQTDIPHPGQQP